MASSELNVVTGAFGFTGKYITRRLLAMGKTVRTITGHPERQSPFGDQVQAFPYNFDRPDELADSLRGATTLYNTYWIRFPYGKMTFDQAVENTRTLIRAAEAAGVHKLVHISITNASEDSPLPYFKGKAILEQAIMQSRLSYALIRPTVIFGAEDILINNIAWSLRKFPLFPVAGSGDYRIQPVYVEDVAERAVQAAQKGDNVAIDAVGPEIYTYGDLVWLIAEKVQSKAKIVHVGPALALLLARLMGYLVKDVVLTRDEVEGLMQGLLASAGPPTGQTGLRRWLEEHRDSVGTRYASELARHYR